MTNINAEQYDKKDLKIMALRERVATLTAEYEDKIADLRVDLTMVSQELESIKNPQNDGTGIDNPPVYPSEAQNEG